MLSLAAYKVLQTAIGERMPYYAPHRTKRHRPKRPLYGFLFDFISLFYLIIRGFFKIRTLSYMEVVNVIVIV